MIASFRPALVLCALAALLGAGCEKPSHENVEKWRGTQKGPQKLEETLRNSGLDPDLRAHAAQVLVSLETPDPVLAAVAAMKDGERKEVLEKLIPRLWDDAKVAEALIKPTSKQLAAKDALFDLRAHADGPNRDLIDGYLVDWLTGYYEGRSELGRHSGSKILRHVGGDKAAPKLIAAARAAVNDPGDGAQILVVEDSLLLGIAMTGTPESVDFLMDLAGRTHADDSLQRRALGAIYHAYVLNQEPPLLDPKGLARYRDTYREWAGARLGGTVPPENINVAFDLLAAIGAPDCLEPLTKLAAHEDEIRRWRAVQYGLKCAGEKGIVPLSRALPENLGYQKGIIEKYFWDKIVNLGPKAAGPARELLQSRSWVARLTGIEVLARVGDKGDAAALRKLKSDKTKARGYHDPKEKKKDPTLGELAQQAANRLEKPR